MKTLSDIQVMNSFYLAWTRKNRKRLQFSEVAMLTQLGKPTLQSVLDRLIKRGLLKKSTDWKLDEDIPNSAGIYHEVTFFKNKTTGKKIMGFDQLQEEYVKEINRQDPEMRTHTGDISYELKRRIFNILKSKIKGRKYTFYSLQAYPYITGDYQNIPDGYKRLWRKSARLLKSDMEEYRKEHRVYPVIIPVKEKMSVIKQEIIDSGTFKCTL